MNEKRLFTDAIKEELQTFEDKLLKSIQSKNKRIQSIIDYVSLSSGKKIRPILVLLVAKYFGRINEVTYNSAITLELLHTASLIHDDVIDESSFRRGRPSCNKVFDNKATILAGDYYLSASLVTSVMTQNFEIISTISKLGKTLAEGELNQLALVKDIILDEKEYLDVIRKKTASLISASMKVGAISTNAPQDKVDIFEKLGDKFGMMFQIRDDIFDYYTNPIGKPTGNDIREGKITLPLLYVLKNSKNKIVVDKAKMIIDTFDFSPPNIEFLLDFAKNEGGIDYAYEKMNYYKEKAMFYLNQLNDGEIKTSLLNILDYMIERKF